MSPFTVLILIAFATGAFGFIDEETELNFADEFSSSEDLSDRIGEWEGKIVGGTTAQPGQFPHQAMLRRSEALGGTFFCGGSIIHRFFILTAATCTQRVHADQKNIRVVVGALRRVNDGIVHEVRSVHNHPEFHHQSLSNVISIVRTVNEILFNTPLVRPVTLPNENVPDGGNLQVTISGWGLTAAHNGRLAKILQFLNTLTLRRQHCIARHGVNGRFVHENTICALSNAPQGACFGDQGGALITRNGVQVGVFSWAGLVCARNPEVYENVWSHIAWIRATISAN